MNTEQHRNLLNTIIILLFIIAVCVALIALGNIWQFVTAIPTMKL